MLRSIFVYLCVLVGLYYALTKGAYYALLFYLWLSYFRPESWVWDPGPLLALQLPFTVGIYLLVRSLFASDIKFRMDLRSALLLSFCGLALVSTLMSKHEGYAWQFWVEFLKVTMITYLIPCLITDMQRLRTVVLTIAFALGFEAAKQGWVGMLLQPGSKNINGLGLLGDNNGVAVGMLMLVGLFIALINTAPTWWEKNLERFFVVGIIYRALATFSRGGFLSAGMLVFVYTLRSKHKIRSAIASLVVAGVVLSVLPQEFWDRMSTIKTSADDPTTPEGQETGDETSSQSRIHFWRVATVMASENPILGVGFNSYNRAYNEYDFLRGAYGKSRSVHSSWFGVLAELGYTGIVLYVAILLLAVIGAGTAARRSRQGKAPPELYYFAVAIQTGFAVFAVGGSFVPWQYNEMLFHFIGLSLAVRNVALAYAKDEVRVRPQYQTVKPRFEPAARSA